ncbi:RNA chaperone Hfq [Bacillus cereus]|uniref:RNA chaperone Hfq n=1 Tax=Bacillus cereus TaxID=1396 RepID=UPI0018F6D679|nr:RNA chaperone Hfq [Bacillus cereus]MBJ8055051.1 RNA chaperone Hfq [Bacillus cereus]
MINIQEELYAKLIEEKKTVTIFLLNGVRIPCQVIATDNFTVLISSNDKQQLLYKHGISTIAV